MGWKTIFGLFFILIFILLLEVYLFFPYGEIEFNFQPKNSNFSLSTGNENMQFYQNMRFPDSNISYKITSCPLQKENDMKKAFEILENLSILEFFLVSSDEQISVTCEDKQKFEGGMFIAGEGGPTNITKSGEFNVILNGEVLLLRESECEKPNIAIHELLHALGVEHSSNSNNIMYNYSKCSQTIGQDIPELINKIYAIPSYPDLTIENASALMNGRYIDINMSIRNNGLKNADESKIFVYANEKQIKEIDLKSLDIGYGIFISISNLWVSEFSVNELKIAIDSSFDELDKENNIVILKMKK